MSLTQKELEDCLAVLAEVYDRCGDRVWPLFVRVEKALEDLRGREDRLAAHRKPRANVSRSSKVIQMRDRRAQISAVASLNSTSSASDPAV